MKSYLTKITTALSEDQYDDIEGWSDMDRYSRLQKFIKTEECTFLQQHKENTKKTFNAQKVVILSCSTDISDRQQYNHNMVLNVTSDEDSDENDDIE